MKYYQRLQPIQISRKETHIFHPILSKNFIINHPDNRSKRENEYFSRLIEDIHRGEKREKYEYRRLGRGISAYEYQDSR